MTLSHKRGWGTPSRSVLNWLLEDDQPAVRYRTLTQLLGRSKRDDEVLETRRHLAERGWIANILAERNRAGWWYHERNLYQPKYIATNWRMLVLADLGVGREHPAVRKSCELWMDRFRLKGGGVGGNSAGTGHHCIVGNMTRALIQMGYEDDPRVRRSLEWIVRTADPKGGWSCFGSGRNLDSWEGLSALAAYPKARWTASMHRCIERGAEFFLQRELHRQGRRYPPWFRFHYPVHYYYDLLVGLELLTSLGYADDPRLRFARQFLEERRRRNGRWILDSVHPDVDGGVESYYRAHPEKRPIPWSLEPPGRPSKIITLRALTVLQHMGL